MTFKFQPGDALLIVDVQNDFCPGGSLPIPEGDAILPIINNLIKEARSVGAPIIASRDWHPPKHISFKAQGGTWPEHCVQNTKGAEFHPKLELPKDAIIINKAFEIDKESYSAFEGETSTGEHLAHLLKAKKIKRIMIGGLALDYCVHFTALDARVANFEVHIHLPATRAIAEETRQKTMSDMKKAGVIIEE